MPSQMAIPIKSTHVAAPDRMRVIQRYCRQTVPGNGSEEQDGGKDGRGLGGHLENF
jgi:hypothetical protein